MKCRCWKNWANDQGSITSHSGVFLLWRPDVVKTSTHFIEYHPHKYRSISFIVKFFLVTLIYLHSTKNNKVMLMAPSELVEICVAVCVAQENCWYRSVNGIKSGQEASGLVGKCQKNMTYPKIYSCKKG